jgi:hypothetical protein
VLFGVTGCRAAVGTDYGADYGADYGDGVGTGVAVVADYETVGVDYEAGVGTGVAVEVAGIAVDTAAVGGIVD